MGRQWRDCCPLGSRGQDTEFALRWTRLCRSCDDCHRYDGEGQNGFDSVLCNHHILLLKDPIDCDGSGIVRAGPAIVPIGDGHDIAPRIQTGVGLDNGAAQQQHRQQYTNQNIFLHIIVLLHPVLTSTGVQKKS